MRWLKIRDMIKMDLEDGVYPCLAEDGVIFLKKENVEGFRIRTDPPVVQNDRYGL